MALSIYGRGAVCLLILATVLHIMAVSAQKDCKQNGGTCKRHRECCSELCKKGQCEAKDENCIPNDQFCTHSRNCCTQRCRRNVCSGLNYKEDGIYDLSPDDLSALCKAVDLNFKPLSRNDCIYMKWHSCPNVQQNENKPCGWYQQTKCDGRMSRQKRSVADIAFEGDHKSEKQVLLNFPENYVEA